jgi:hypothetical protein
MAIFPGTGPKHQPEGAADDRDILLRRTGQGATADGYYPDGKSNQLPHVQRK